MFVTSREKKILSLLFDAKDSITIKEIASNLNISERTIHRDLKHVQTTLKKFNLEIERIQGVGLRLKGSTQQKKKFKNIMNDFTQIDFTPRERQSIILSALYQAREPIKIFTLANELKVTTATISNDLSLLDKRLQSFHLQLIRKRSLGVELVGEEINKRKAISHLISDFFDPLEFISKAKKKVLQEEREKSYSISNRLLNLVDQETLKTIEMSVQKLRDELMQDIADSAYIALVVHLALAIQRLQNGDYINFNKDYLKEIQQTKEFKIAKRLCKHLEASLSITIPEDEVGYITMHLLGAKLHVEHNYQIEESSLDIALLASDLIQYVSEELSIPLYTNDNLLNDLVAHLKPAIYRIEQKMTIKNPLLKTIQKDYKDLYSLVKKGTEEIYPIISFPADEIGYITLHFASALLNKRNKAYIRALVVCSSGIGTAKILETELYRNIKEIKTIDNKSMFELKEIETSYDIVISTIRLDHYKGDYLLISPILSDQDVQKIKSYIREKQLLKLTKKENKDIKTKKGKVDVFKQLQTTQNYVNVILSILQSFYVKEIKERKTIKEVLTEAVKQLEKAGILNKSEEVVADLIKREKMSGLGIPGTGVALYHTRSKQITKPSFTIYTLHHPLTIKSMTDDDMEIDSLILMLAPTETKKVILEVLSYISSLLIQHDKAIDILSSGKEEKIKLFLSEELYSFYLQRINKGD